MHSITETSKIFATESKSFIFKNVLLFKNALEGTEVRAFWARYFFFWFKTITCVLSLFKSEAYVFLLLLQKFSSDFFSPTHSVICYWNCKGSEEHNKRFWEPQTLNLVPLSRIFNTDQLSSKIDRIVWQLIYNYIIFH